MKSPPYSFLLIGSDVASLKEELEKRNHRIEIYFDGKEAIKKLEKTNACTFDVILLNLDIPGLSGWEIIRRLRSFKKTQMLPVIVLSDFDDETSEIQSLNLGADDYLVKTCSIKLLLARIESTIRKNNNFFIIEEELPFNNNTTKPLTKREKEILRYVIKGHTNKQIAEKVYITTLTVKNHIKTIFRKLNVNNRTQAVIFALKNNLVQNINI